MMISSFLLYSDQMKSFSWYNNAILLRKLCLFAWSNCSILRTLVSYCSKAIKLLDKFESNLDPLKPVACYPIPYLSSDMIPSDTSTYTILAVRCDKELYWTIGVPSSMYHYKKSWVSDTSIPS